MTYQTIRKSLGSLQVRWIGPGVLERNRFVVTKREFDRTYFALWKRFIDIAFSLAAIILLSPLMVITGALIRLTSPGPVIYKQERIGINRRVGERRRRYGGKTIGERRRRKDRRVLANYGKPFFIYKFRTMYESSEGGKPQWAIKDDPRITPLGKILRKTRIDELPQFFNVLKGDMSLVGPRPERAFFIRKVEHEIPEFQLRLRAKPGITGLAQVRLGYTNNTEGLKKKLRFDLEYISRLSFWSDFKIMLKTIGVVLTGKGAC
jgi:lipopolysaccharide/colanic/teichoic acid biosynthesis glycosyltransferase